MITFYIHIGAGKTGTSSIQEVLQSNTKILAENGFFYPNLDKVNTPPVFNHAAYLLKNNNNKAKISEDIIQCFNYCKKNNLTSVILSWESPAYWAWRYIVSAINSLNAQLKIIFYVRRQDSWLESAWKQWGIKSEHTDIRSYVKSVKEQANWHQVIQQWPSETHNNFTVRIYDREKLMNNDVVSDFFSILGFDQEHKNKLVVNKSKKAVNSGFNRDILEILNLTKQLTTHIHDNSVFNFLNDSLSESFQKKSGEKYNLLSQEQRQELFEYYYESNKIVSKKYLEGELIFPPIEKKSIEEEQYKGLTPNSIVPVLMDLIYSNYRKIAEIRNTINKIQSNNNLNSKLLYFSTPQEVFSLQNIDTKNFLAFNKKFLSFSELKKIEIKNVQSEVAFSITSSLSSNKYHIANIVIECDNDCLLTFSPSFKTKPLFRKSFIYELACTKGHNSHYILLDSMNFGDRLRIQIRGAIVHSTIEKISIKEYSSEFY